MINDVDILIILRSRLMFFLNIYFYFQPVAGIINLFRKVLLDS